MDFGTIKNKLNNNLYDGVAGFLNEMRLVFSNCVTYNGAESEIGLISKNLEKEFDRLCHDNHIDQYLHDEGKSEMRTEDNRGDDDMMAGIFFEER